MRLPTTRAVLPPVLPAASCIVALSWVEGVGRAEGAGEERAAAHTATVVSHTHGIALG